MNDKLSDYFLGKMKYDSQVISGVMGLKNAADLMYDVSPKDLGVIQPPWMPNMRFSKYVITGELICWARFGVDPDIFEVTNPTFYVYQTQIDLYCTLADQDPDLIKPIFYPSDCRPLEGVEDEQPDWMNNVEKPVLDFLSNVDEHCLYAQVPKEMVIQLSEPETINMDNDNQNIPNHISYLSNTQQDELMRKYILQEKSFTPEARCSECTNRACKSCQILQNHKSYAAYLAYQCMFQDMKLIEVDGKKG